jgi:nucleotide-binding universal stress UspA family protein
VNYNNGKEGCPMYGRILAPLDGSELSELSLEHVKKVAMAGETPEVVLLMVLEGISYLTYVSNTRTSDSTIRNIEKENQDKAQEYMDKVADRLKNEGISAQGVVVWGRPADEILKYIKENKIDLVIMSTHGRSGIPRWAFGSVADKVIRYSTAPILIVPPNGFRDDESRSQ